jgi:U3 small nucleolar RNA-associated protein 20
MQEHLDLLRLLPLKLPQHFASLAVLTNPDLEIDFCTNIAHLQVHRRSRALRRIATVAAAGQLSPGVLLGVIVPLLQQIIAEGQRPIRDGSVPFELGLF